MTPLEKCYEKIAKKHNLSKYQVEDIFRAQFDFVAETMEKPERESIRLPFIGTFYSNKEKIKYDRHEVTDNQSAEENTKK